MISVISKLHSKLPKLTATKHGRQYLFLEFSFKKNLILERIPAYSSILGDKRLVIFLIYYKKHILRIFVTIALHTSGK